MGTPITPFVDVAYTDPVPAETNGNLIDVFVPACADGRVLPTIVWTTGSAWLADDGKQGVAPIAAELNPRGYVVVGLSIRSSQQTTFPGQLYDIRAAIRFLRSNAQRFCIDPDRIAMMGNSSGGWAAAIAATTSSIRRLDGEADSDGVSSAVQAAVAFFPPVDFVAMDAQTIEQVAVYAMNGDSLLRHDDPDSPESLLVGYPIQDRPDLAAGASPLRYIDGTEPPTAILHGTMDPLLPPGQSRSLYGGLRDAGSQVALTLVHGAGHEVTTPTPGAPARPFEVGHPVIDRPGFSMWRAEARVETVGAGVEPTWDAIDAFIVQALGGSL